MVPVSAVLRDDENLPFVYLALPDGSFARRHVTLGYRDGQNYQIDRAAFKPATGSSSTARSSSSSCRANERPSDRAGPAAAARLLLHQPHRRREPRSSGCSIGLLTLLLIGVGMRA